MSLRAFVRRRTGLPLGAPGSLRAMLARSLAAPSFHVFWQYWNPVWGYYLGTRVYQPLQTWLPAAAARVVTFVVSGALHDLAVMLVKGYWPMFFTPWFTLMGFLTALSAHYRLHYPRFLPAPIANLALLSTSFATTSLLLAL